MNSKTIAAISTPRGIGAIAVIRISGPGAIQLVGKCLASSSSFFASPARSVGLYQLISPRTGKQIDEVTAVKYVSPRSFTGEDMVELFCHGGEIIVDKALTMILDEGIALAERGEFSRRAFLNDKFDLLKAESVLGLVESKTEKEYSSAINAYQGSASKKLKEWKEDVVSVLRDVEAAIEFPDEGDVQDANKDYVFRISEIRKKIEMELIRRERSRLIEKGIMIPVVGISNAGKSSFFNLVLGFERAIVHSEEGTTRDGIGEYVEIGGERITLMDTAGLRETKNDVERLGIEKTLNYLLSAPLMVWVSPANRDIMPAEAKLLQETDSSRIVCVVSKVDLADAGEKMALCEKYGISCLKTCLLNIGERSTIVDFLGNVIRERIGSMETSDVVRTARHEMISKQMVGNLIEIESAGSFGDEIMAEKLKLVLSDIAEFAGETSSAQILDSIFSKFCIGK